MKLRALLLSAICICVLSLRALAWGNLGHEAIALLAWQELSESDRAAIHGIFAADPALFGSKTDAESLAFASIWPDLLRAGHQHGGHMQVPLHIFASLGIASSTDKRCDNLHFADYKGDAIALPGDNVTDAIRASYNALADPKSTAVQRGEALCFLIHCVGDCHQPLHCGNESDLGGNSIQLSGLGAHEAPTNLHSVWDSGLFLNAGIRTPEALLAAIQPLPGDKTNSVPADWMAESHALAQSNCYRDENGKPIQTGEHLSAAYVARNLPVAEARLALAASRLARLLHEALAASAR